MNNINKRNILPTRRSRRVAGLDPYLSLNQAPSSFSNYGVSATITVSSQQFRQPRYPQTIQLAVQAGDRPQQTSRALLLQIPAEIRLQIYGYIIKSAAMVDTMHEGWCFDPNKTRVVLLQRLQQEESWLSDRSCPPEKGRLALARTCSAIREEILPLYYGGARDFNFRSTSDLQTYLSLIPLSSRALLRNISFWWSHHEGREEDAFKLLKDCTSLEKIEAVIIYNDIDTSKAKYKRNKVWTLKGLDIFRTLRVSSPDQFKLEITCGQDDTPTASRKKKYMTVTRAKEVEKAIEMEISENSKKDVKE